MGVYHYWTLFLKKKSLLLKKPFNNNSPIIILIFQRSKLRYRENKLLAQMQLVRGGALVERELLCFVVLFSVWSIGDERGGWFK